MRKNFSSFVPFGARKLALGALATGAFLVACALLSLSTQAAPAPKVDVCHFPPGNLDNFHTIRISENALSAHLAHGDLTGSCNALCADICDDGDACTIDDTDDCELEGCPPVPRDPTDCNDSLACTDDSCVSASGCSNVPKVCTPSDLCHSSACAEPEGMCMETDVVCDSGFSCDPSSGTCEPDTPICVTALDHIGNGDTSAMTQDCQQNGDCNNTRECGRASSGDLDDCARFFDRDACDRVNDHWQTAAGCSICAPTPVPPSNCPCWDGGLTSALGISNVVELWERYGPTTCSSEDCSDTITSGVSTRTSAECLGSVWMQTSVVSNTNFVDAQCTVTVNGQKLADVSFPVGSSEAEACIAEHDTLITLGGTFPNYSASLCGLFSF